MKKVNRILLVDDDETTNLLNKRLISRLELADKVDLAYDGYEALGYLIKQTTEAEYPKPDLIFLDVRMPVMDGFEFLTEYNKLDQKFKAKAIVVMLSTSLREEDVSKAKQLHVTDYRPKPLTEEMLYDIMNTYFSN